ncbi:DUF1579 family protein [Brevibacillus fortis]|uniref:DUF1579 domain-containing protein n=1 Tax=Brevibacillus fortis TaxID=2126352 RepID=A0A2P7ULW3_9BACL|nr:DUF1579 family protein [Brevibacillus fortis]MED1780850.1 DUF1579 family protein [Brevibacillus fortis]PSJ87937.1 hypothetical protein C7R93_25840 [Brevibacillus fortis]
MINEHVNHISQEVPEPDPALTHLNIFVGKWVTDGLIMESPAGQAAKLKATDTYEWLPGGYFLIHHVDGMMGDKEVKTIEIIGYDTTSQMYFTHAYDNYGSRASYYANLLGRDWTITGKTERFTGKFSVDGNTLIGTWELLGNNESWAHWMDIRLRKVE